MANTINTADPVCVTGTLMDEVCKCCGGMGVQTNKQTGITQHCPCCGGTGRRRYTTDGSPIITCRGD